MTPQDIKEFLPVLYRIVPKRPERKPMSLKTAAKRPAFWMVWNPQGQAPTRQHENKLSAEREAERLARANRGQRFIVLQSIGERVVDDVQVISHVADHDDEVPF